ncbi:glycosyl hydrolase family 76 protein [Penicillium macrosclerotiorum]|uniref:glycosyl hydrolase family 76 protein n=1 Tax=Penicillium macrosclerotiorum TaxID=303699 RepID=UPI002549A3E6|nr:glycosyl hydrolase family 76 protein [Penicillium macrosclerotiorum]KAJ5692205.1 glycosyl hydrolase family 76 protein [Penicillium macrosclerotiorum]
MLVENWKTVFAVTLLTGSTSAINLDINSESSIKNAASVVAKNTISDYNDRNSNNIPGYVATSWAEGGVLFESMIRYWYYTGDSSNNELISDGMYWQRGEDDYFPANYSSYLGNDDQIMWALAAMTGAELGFPQRSSMPSWATLAKNVFDELIVRWDDQNCNGGMRWQIWPFEAGYTTKNAITNGGLFELAARLARYTNNQTYSDWAEKVWDWSSTTPLLETADWKIADSTTCETKCTDHGDWHWSWNYGVYMTGAAYMYNITDGKGKWKTGLDGLLNSSSQFFPDHGYNNADGKVMVEITCEAVETCNKIQQYMKGTFLQDLAMISVVAPYTSSGILPLLKGTATAAAQGCTGGKDDTRCSGRWYIKAYDGDDSMANQISALSLFTSNLVAFNSNTPFTQSTASNTTTGSVTSSGSENSTSSGTVTATTTGNNAASVLVGAPVSITAAMFSALLHFF